MQIIDVEGVGTNGFNLELLIWIIVGTIAGTVSILGAVVIKRRYNQSRDLKSYELAAKDDIAEVRWFKFCDLLDAAVVESHQPLLEILRRKDHDHSS